MSIILCSVHGIQTLASPNLPIFNGRPSEGHVQVTLGLGLKRSACIALPQITLQRRVDLEAYGMGTFSRTPANSCTGKPSARLLEALVEALVRLPCLYERWV